ncbi:MAG: YraN family protein [Deltaproteobacteria bacterium]|nr:MAG: YraN family protein [Deltaproteobacteria bacterium]
MVRDRRLDAGRAAERVAVRYLRRKGLRIVARNVRLPSGEIDIVARDGDTLVFVEVRCRASGRWGTALDAIGPAKQHQVARVAEAYLTRHPASACRFDVVGVTGDVVVHIEDAFRPDDRAFARTW